MSDPAEQPMIEPPSARAAPAQPASLSGVQKAATLLLAMGKENAGKLSGYFSKEELQAMVDVAGTLPGLDAGQITNLIGEFGQNYQNHAVHAQRGELTRMLESLSGNNSEDDVEEAETTGANSFTQERPASEDPDADAIVAFFEREPPVYSAILINSLSDAVSAKALGMIEADQRKAIIDAYLNRKQLDPETEAEIAADLLDLVRASDNSDDDAPQVEKAAHLMNFFGEDIAEDLLGFISGQNPELANQIRKQIFRFPMIKDLEKQHRARLFDTVESDEVVAALSGADDAMKECVLETLSQRTRRMVEAELARGGVSQDASDDARRNISGQAVSLAREGKIVLPGEDA